LGAAVLPVLTVLVGGFLGAGAAVLATLAVYIASFYRPRWHVVAGAFFLSYLGLSIFVTYLGTRSDIRGAVWGGEGLPVRLSVLGQALASFRPFDPTDPDKLTLIDIRMNQNYLRGLPSSTGGRGTSFARARRSATPSRHRATRGVACNPSPREAGTRPTTLASVAEERASVSEQPRCTSTRQPACLLASRPGALVTFFDFLAAGRLVTMMPGSSAGIAGSASSRSAPCRGDRRAAFGRPSRRHHRALAKQPVRIMHAAAASSTHTGGPAASVPLLCRAADRDMSRSHRSGRSPNPLKVRRARSCCGV
jgi:hypothetical protein